MIDNQSLDNWITGNYGEDFMDDEKEQAFDEFLDDVFGTVSIAGADFRASEILKELDPIAYEQAMLDWEDTYANEDY